MTSATPQPMIASSDAARVALPPPRHSPFAEDKAGFAYFRSDYHHRFLGAAILQRLAEGRCFLLVSGEAAADGELLRRFLDENGKERYRASLVRCRAGMDFSGVIRAYSQALGLRQEGEGGAIWSLLSQLMHEARNGITRVLILEHAEMLAHGSIDELLRFTQLDQPRAMPVMLVARHGGAETEDAPPFAFPESALAARIPVERLEPEEVGAFIRYQLNALTEHARTPFAPEMVLAIAAAAQGSPTAVNRLTRQAMEAAARGSVAVRAPALPALAAAPAVDAAALPALAAASAIAAAAPAVEAAADETPPGASPARPRLRLPSAMVACLYIAIVSFSGLALLYLLAPRTPSPAASSVVAEQPSPDAGAAETASPSAPAASESPPPPPAQLAALPPAEAGSVAPAPVPAAAVPESESPPPPPPPQPDAPPLSEANVAEPAPVSVAAAPESENVPPPPSEAEGAKPALALVAAAPESASAPPPSQPLPAAPPPSDASDAKAAPAQVAAAPTPAASESASAPPLPQPAAPPPEADDAKPVPAPVAATPAPAASDTMPAPVASRVAPDIALMVRRGYQLLAVGDIASARRFFERAAPAGDAAAENGLAKSYDPQFLRRLGTVGLAGDSATALVWYRRAAAAGSAEALARLQQLGATATADPASGK